MLSLSKREDGSVRGAKVRAALRYRAMVAFSGLGCVTGVRASRRPFGAPQHEDRFLMALRLDLMLRSARQSASRSTQALHPALQASCRSCRRTPIYSRPDFCYSYDRSGLGPCTEPSLRFDKLSMRGWGVNMARETKSRDRRLSTQPTKPAASPRARTTTNLWLRLHCAVFNRVSHGARWTDLPPGTVPESIREWSSHANQQSTA